MLVAHGIGGRTDLPLSVWMFGYGAAAALVVSFAALAVFWPQARLEGPPPAALTDLDDDDRRAGGNRVLRVVGLLLLLVVFGAAAFGDELVSQNLAPVAIYVLFWVGLTVIAALVADLWNRGLDPYLLLGDAVAPAEPRAYTLGHWPAAAGLLAFVWLELVYPDRAEPRVLAVLLVVYTAVVLAGAVRWGRPWLRHGETFAAWFGLLGAMAPVGPDGLRPPLVGLARFVPRPGTLALVLVALGSTAFDGLTRSSFWSGVIDGRSADEAVPHATVGLLLSIVVVALLYLGAMRIASAMTGRPTLTLADDFVHSLVPIALAYAVAHYFSLLVLEGQAALALVSDPFGQGWDLFGTADWSIDYTLVSPNAIAYVQVGAIVAGHVAGVVLAHDRALARLPKAVATRSQYPLLAVMVAYTVGGLGLLLGA
jgi:hypothetical protein